MGSSPPVPPLAPGPVPGRWWTLLLAPCAVLALGLLLFEVSAFGFPTLAPAAPALPVDGSGQVAPADFPARVLWGAAVLLHLVTCGASLAVALQVMRRVPRGYLRSRVAPWAAVLVGAQLVVALVDGFAPAFQGLFGFTWNRLLEDGRYGAVELGRIRNTVEVLNLASAVVPVVVLLAGALCVRPRGSSPGLADVAERLAQARTLLQVGSAMLVTGVVHMAAWTRWPAALVAGDVPVEALEQSTSAVVLFWGATYSALAVAWYLPTFLTLRAQANAIWEQRVARGEEPSTPRGEWLAEHGFADGPLQRLPRLAALAAPLLAGPVGSALAEFGGSAG